MPLANTAHRVVAGAVVTVALLAMAAAGLVWHAGGADATGTQTVASTAPRPEPTTTSSSTTTSTSTTSTTRPRPTTTTAPPTTAPRRVVATTPPTVAPAPVAPPATQPPSAGASAEERCLAALKWVGQHGLALPAGWGFRCPGQALENGAPRWGIACWNCAGDGKSYIAVDIGRIGSSEKALYYVIAHEICHAVDYETTGNSSELGADLCAALHGAPRP